MFVFRSMNKYLFGDASKETIIELPQGQLFIVRPLSPKGYSELIFKDAKAAIRRTAQEFHYQLVISKAYDPDDPELSQDEGPDEDSLDKDEKTFLLDQSLHFRSKVKDGGDKILAWRDLSGDAGDLYEFVCGEGVQGDKVATFELAAIECQYERKYRKTAQKATEEDLKEFEFDEAVAQPAGSPLARKTPEKNPTSKESATRMAKDVKTPKGKKANTAVARKDAAAVAPVTPAPPKALSEFARQRAELHIYDFETTTFILQDSATIATVSEIGNWRYWLQISGADKEWVGLEVVADLNPVFNFEYLSFIFNQFTEDSAYSWLLRFPDQTALERFQEGLMQALWEQLHEVKWHTLKNKADQDYVLHAFNDMTMDDVGGEEEEDEEYEDGPESEPAVPAPPEDSDEDELEEEDDRDINSQLAVGAKNDRSYVVRGNQIGVFKHQPNKNLEFSTNIAKVAHKNGRLFSPKKIMLHAEDRNMILQDEANPNSLFRMDLEYGKVVDEWKVSNEVPVKAFTQEHKFDQQTSHQPFLGISSQAVYRIDPRLKNQDETKMDVDSIKQYQTATNFSAVATTKEGYIAIASAKGEIRLFDRLGINAKTLIPALGDPIIAMDVTADGKYTLATCRTYLLLIDNVQKDGKYEGKLGFERAFAKEKKPQPRRLALSPSHVAQFQHETGTGIAFTPAKFNISIDQEESSIITSTGPFLVTWSLKKVLKGTKDPYQIKRYGAEVMSDNFEFGSDKNVILALPNSVNMVNRKTFRRPTRESIANVDGRLGVRMSPRRSGGGSGVGVGGRQSALRGSTVVEYE